MESHSMFSSSDNSSENEISLLHMYVDNCSLWNQENSDEKNMQRRKLVRRQCIVLDDEQTRDAMKLLEKYVRRKYRNSTLICQDGSEDVDQAATPIGHTQSACQFARQMTAAEQLSHVFHSTPLGPVPSDYGPPISPAFSPPHQPSFKSEMQLKETESWSSYFIRINKFLYEFLGIQYFILAIVIIGYACLGGWIFMFLEQEHQIVALNDEKNIMINESKTLAENLLNYMKELNCSSTNDEKCLSLITRALIERSDKIEVNIRGVGWRWDFWNSVFFAATIFTTIGYGNIACKTSTGRIVTIIYGLIGIPLMLFVLKVYGELATKNVQKIRYFLKRTMRSCIRSFKSGSLTRSATVESVTSEEIKEYSSKNSESEDDDDRFATFPVKWALVIVFLFMVLCSFIVSFWEKWDFLTAFYFFFVSLSTIGFGDVIPEHPRTACGLFILYFVGLALFSMVYAILQERVENQYMWALELIDQEYQENQKLEQQIECDEVNDKLSQNDKGGLPNANSQTSIRWRQNAPARSLENMPDRPESERRFSVFTPGEPPQFAPPVLGAFMLHNLSMKKKLIARSESILNKTKRPTSFFPSNEQLSTPINSSRGGSPWMLNAELNNPKEATALGKSSGLSAPNLSGGNRSPSGALSVITEASDEDSRHFKKHVSRRYLMRTEAKDDDLHQASNESLDQVMDELQLDAPHNHSITPKPFIDHQNLPMQFLKLRKSNDQASTSERLPLSPKDTLEEEDEDVSE